MTPLDPAQRLEALQAVFEALAHPARRQILLTVHFRGGAMTAGDIAGRFAHAWPTTTRHLRVLESAGLLTQERRGRERLYRVERRRLDLVAAWLVWFDRPSALIDDVRGGGLEPARGEAPATAQVGDEGARPTSGPGSDAMAKTDVVLAKMREICLSLPDTKETMTWGNPHFRVGDKIFAGCGAEGSEQSIGFKLEMDHAEAMLGDARFQRAPYVGHKGWLSMDASGIRDWNEVRTLILESYRLIAPKRSLAKLAGAEGGAQVDVTTATRAGAASQRGPAKAAATRKAPAKAPGARAKAIPPAAAKKAAKPPAVKKAAKPPAVKKAAKPPIAKKPIKARVAPGSARKTQAP